MAYYQGDPYGRPPPGPPGGYGPRPPPGPPPPLPPGWVQEWEPNMRRVFWIEEATGRTQWEPPFAGPPPPGPYYDNRGPPAPGGYYAPPPGPPPPGAYNQGGGYDYPPQQEEKSNMGKYLAVGAGALAVGAIGGAFVEHEIDENREEDDERRAYDEGREDQYEDDGGW